MAQQEGQVERSVQVREALAPQGTSGVWPRLLAGQGLLLVAGDTAKHWRLRR
jgi:hypothetical protein